MSVTGSIYGREGMANQRLLRAFSPSPYQRNGLHAPNNCKPCLLVQSFPVVVTAGPSYRLTFVNIGYLYHPEADFSLHFSSYLCQSLQSRRAVCLMAGDVIQYTSLVHRRPAMMRKSFYINTLRCSDCAVLRQAGFHIQKEVRRTGEQRYPPLFTVFVLPDLGRFRVPNTYVSENSRNSL